MPPPCSEVSWPVTAGTAASVELWWIAIVFSLWSGLRHPVWRVPESPCQAHGMTRKGH